MEILESIDNQRRRYPMNDEVKVRLLKVAACLTGAEIALRNGIAKESEPGEVEKIISAIFSNYVKVAVDQFLLLESKYPSQ